jgi:AhpD family alkylhydroperoxidase
MACRQTQTGGQRTPGVPLCADDSEALLGVVQRGGEVSNLYRCLANQPMLLEAWTDFAWRLRAECATPRALRELLILRAAQLTGAQYVLDDHVRFGRDAGLSDARIQALSSWRSSGAGMFDARERAALELAEQLVVSGQVADEGLEMLERHFSASEIVELALTVGFYAMVPRVINALRVPLTET